MEATDSYFLGKRKMYVIACELELCLFRFKQFRAKWGWCSRKRKRIFQMRREFEEKMKQLKENPAVKEEKIVAEQFPLETRIDSAGEKGTVKYVGEVADTGGIWLGIDWDNPQRGKHNGTYKGIQYFQTRYPTSGSFVRPSKISTAISIIEAIESRYGLITEPNQGLNINTIIEIQNEFGANLFEVVGVEKLNKMQSDFRNLNVVFLRDYPVNSAGPPLALLHTCPNIQELDLSKTLLSSWETVAEIADQLKYLKFLNLSENRIKISGDIRSESFSQLQHLVLGNLTYNWSQVLKCCEFFLNIEALQVQQNNISTLEEPSPNILTNLKMLDFDGNPIDSWDEINKLGKIETLEILFLSCCGIKNIHLPSSEDSTQLTDLFKNLRILLLTGNKIDDWSSINELNKLRSLHDLRFRENPLLAKESLETNHQLIIARIKNLKLLNGIEILKEERKGAEIDYLKRFGLDWLSLKTEEEMKNFNQLHPCYQRLVEKYGAPDENELKAPPTSLKSQLIEIEIFSSNKSIFKKVPYNMSVQKLSGLIQRLFNIGSTMPNLSCIHSQRKHLVEVPLDDNLKDLNFYSVENGDKICVRW